MRMAGIFAVVTVVTFVFGGCSNVASDVEDALRSEFRGGVWIEGRDSTDDLRGVRIEALNTPLFTYTDSTGSFRLRDLRRAEYVFAYCLEGYDTTFVGKFTMLPPQNFVIPLEQLYRTRTLSVTLDSVTFNFYSAILHYGIQGSHHLDDSAQVTLLASKTRDGVKEWRDSAVFGGLPPAVRKGKFIPISLNTFDDSTNRLRPIFKPGDSVYFVAYRTKGNVAVPGTLRYRYVNVSDRSNVIGFKLP